MIPEKENSDRPAKEKRRDEWEKIKKLGWKERLVYFWDYYKIVIVIVIALIIAIQSGMTIWKNIHTEELLNAMFLNSNYFPSEEERITDSFEEYIGGLEKDQVVTLDFSLNINENAVDNMTVAAQTKLTAYVMDGMLDVMVMPRELYDNYAAQEMFGGMDELLTEEELQKWNSLFLKETLEGREVITAVNVSDSPVIRDNQMYLGSEAYLSIPATSKGREMAAEFLRFMMEGVQIAA